MTKSELIQQLSEKSPHLSVADVDFCVKAILEHITMALAHGERVEIRGFGSFSVHLRSSRLGRNPKTGQAVPLSAKYVPHFKPGKELRARVNQEFPHNAHSNAHS